MTILTAFSNRDTAPSLHAIPVPGTFVASDHQSNNRDQSVQKISRLVRSILSHLIFSYRLLRRLIVKSYFLPLHILPIIRDLQKSFLWMKIYPMDQRYKNEKALLQLIQKMLILMHFSCMISYRKMSHDLNLLNNK